MARPMTDQLEPDFGVWDPQVSELELRERCSRNFMGLLILTARFLEQHGISVEAWGDYIGEQNLASVNGEQSSDAGSYMKEVLTDFISFGAIVTEVKLDRDNARAVIDDLPPAAICGELGVPITVIDELHRLEAPQAAAAGIAWSWRRSGSRLVCTASRLPQE